MHIFSFRPTIYIELTDTGLTIAKIKKTAHDYHVIASEHSSLAPLSIVNGTIYNPSLLCTTLTNLMKTLKIIPNQSRALLALPDITKLPNSIPSHCAALQATLCAAKTGLTITKVIASSLINCSENRLQPLKKTSNLLETFYAPNAHLRLQLLGACALLLATCYYCFEETLTTKTNISIIAKEITQLNAKNEISTKQQVLSDNLSHKFNETQITIDAMQTFLKQHTSYAPLLKVISQTIPHHIFLTSLEIGKKAQNLSQGKTAKKKTKKLKPLKKQLVPLIIKGYGNNAEQIISFSQALNSSKRFRLIKLTNLKRIKSKKKDALSRKNPFRYIFSLKMTLI